MSMIELQIENSVRLRALVRFCGEAHSGFDNVMIGFRALGDMGATKRGCGIDAYACNGASAMMLDLLHGADTGQAHGMLEGEQIALPSAFVAKLPKGRIMLRVERPSDGAALSVCTAQSLEGKTVGQTIGCRLNDAAMFPPLGRVLSDRDGKVVPGLPEFSEAGTRRETSAFDARLLFNAMQAFSEIAGKSDNLCDVSFAHAGVKQPAFIGSRRVNAFVIVMPMNAEHVTPDDYVQACGMFVDSAEG